MLIITLLTKRSSGQRWKLCIMYHIGSLSPLLFPSVYSFLPLPLPLSRICILRIRCVCAIAAATAAAIEGSCHQNEFHIWCTVTEAGIS